MNKKDKKHKKHGCDIPLVMSVNIMIMSVILACCAMLSI